MDYRYLTESKNEFNNFLCGILVPHLYHGIRGMLKYSENVFNQIELKNKKGAKIENPGVINIFKKTLGGISNLNNHEIEEEYLRIKNSSGCVEWFDNMVRASFKSYVLFLTWDPQISNSKYSDNSIYETIGIKDFIHRCYVISCNYFKENPEIFISKNSKKEVFDILKQCVEMSIKKSLPYNQIIQEYLNIEFDKTNEVNSKEIQNIKSMVFNIMNEQKYGSRPEIKNLIVDTGGDEFVDLEDPEYKKAQLENFINQEKMREQNKLNGNFELTSDELPVSKSDVSKHSIKSYISSKSFEKNRKVVDESTSSDEMSGGNNEIDNDSISSGQNQIQTNTHEQIASSGTNEPNITTNPDTGENQTSSLLSRAEMKNKEITQMIGGSKSSSIVNSTTSEDNTNTNTNSKHKKNLTSNVASSDTGSKSSVVKILSEPPAIRQKAQDRMTDLFELAKKNGSGSNTKTDKKNIKVKRVKNNMMSEKFDQAESFYDNMIKL
jgi:hypothetical protein